jgi:hypothetical protein
VIFGTLYRHMTAGRVLVYHFKILSDLDSNHLNPV